MWFGGLPAEKLTVWERVKTLAYIDSLFMQSAMATKPIGGPTELQSVIDKYLKSTQHIISIFVKPKGIRMFLPKKTISNVTQNAFLGNFKMTARVSIQ